MRLDPLETETDPLTVRRRRSAPSRSFALKFDGTKNTFSLSFATISQLRIETADRQARLSYDSLSVHRSRNARYSELRNAAASRRCSGCWKGRGAKMLATRRYAHKRTAGKAIASAGKVGSRSRSALQLPA